MHRNGSRAVALLALVRAAAAAHTVGTCATGQAAPIRIGPPFLHEDNALKLEYSNRRAVTIGGPDAGPGLSLLSQNLGTVDYQGEKYSAKRVELHLPGEHALGSRPLALEAQVLHQSPTNRTLAVSLLFQVGEKKNRFVDDILHGLRAPQGLGGARAVHLHQGLASLMGTGSDYFAYSTPALCGAQDGTHQDADRWIILSKMKKVSAAQLAELKQLAPEAASTTRPLQTRLPTTVLFSTSKKLALRGLPTKRSQLLQTEQKPALLQQQASRSQVLDNQGYAKLVQEVQGYEAQLMQANTQYQKRLAQVARAAQSGAPGAMALLQKERARYSQWAQAAESQDQKLRAKAAMYAAEVQHKAAPAELQHETEPRKQAFVSVEATTHRRSAEQESAESATAVALEHRLEAARKALEAQQAKEKVNTAAIAKREAAAAAREQLDAKREAAATAREQRDAAMEVQLQQYQQMLYSQAAALQQKQQALMQASAIEQNQAKALAQQEAQFQAAVPQYQAAVQAAAQSQAAALVAARAKATQAGAAMPVMQQVPPPAVAQTGQQVPAQPQAVTQNQAAALAQRQEQYRQMVLQAAAQGQAAALEAARAKIAKPATPQATPPAKKAHGETVADAETFRFEMGTKHHQIHGMSLTHAAATPKSAAFLQAQSVIAPPALAAAAPMEAFPDAAFPTPPPLVLLQAQ